MLGTKIYKNDMSNYTECAIWCNQNKATIEDKGDYYEVVTLPLPTLEEIKQHKIAELKAERDSKEVEPITYNGNLYDYDDKARERINAAIIALELQGANADIAWTTADNQDVSVTAADLRAIVAAVAVRSNLLHVAYRKAKERVEAAGSADEVNAVTMN
ncbi:DUF4376 domain-containing protein [Phascolarctobacterium succinatutens]|uniref:DUF4376 domain-containing protein n=1 Tax=Phascolarctobacterium succinatutens TaxID=626940 RepID=UPI0026DBB0DE|nr:DUF4376 domain-containing protein [Phascolarctobacterium succinatutens]